MGAESPSELRWRDDDVEWDRRLGGRLAGAVGGRFYGGRRDGGG